MSDNCNAYNVWISKKVGNILLFVKERVSMELNIYCYELNIHVHTLRSKKFENILPGVSGV